MTKTYHQGRKALTYCSHFRVHQRRRSGSKGSEIGSRPGPAGALVCFVHVVHLSRLRLASAPPLPRQHTKKQDELDEKRIKGTVACPNPVQSHFQHVFYEVDPL